MSKKLETATLAAGCFWCVEAIYKMINGVESVVSGYSGGDYPNPTYEDLHYKKTGHAEAIQIKFDPDVISYKDIIDIFWRIHDPTTLNRQGIDVGEEYRSAIFYHNDEQKKIAEESREEFDEERRRDVDVAPSVVTAIEPFKNFYPAEDYHQNFYENNTRPSYCRFVIDPKVEKFKKKYADKLKIKD